MSEAVLNIKDLNQNYGDLKVLNNISLTVQAGEYVGLIGINGAGKTTLIKSVLDFISIKSGQIEIFGKSHRLTESREKLSFLPEKFLPPYYLTGLNFLSYMAELNKVEFSESEIKSIFNILDLDESALNKSVRQYSKGMAQKLGPCILFFEPEADALIR